MRDKPALVAAVSGGVDSMVMLDKLIREDNYRLIVAHVNHGIRPDSDEDEALVRSIAKLNGLIFESISLTLGRGVSEQTARQKRHQFLSEVKLKHAADQVATAHHLDDVVETIIINFMRGTGWRGLCSLRETADFKRPLIDLRKSQVVAYAIDHKLAWREDSTNHDLKYRRNLIRHFYLPRLSAGEFNQLVELWRRQYRLRPQIDELTAPLKGGEFNRAWLKLNDGAAVELLRAWLGLSYQTATLQRLLKFGRTALTGKKFNLPGNQMIRAELDKLVAIGRR